MSTHARAYTASQEDSLELDCQLDQVLHLERLSLSS